jgi:hypothetical protein
MNADPYTDTIPGFIPDADLTREWAEANLGDRLVSFARALADQFAQTDEMDESERAA